MRSVVNWLAALLRAAELRNELLVDDLDVVRARKLVAEALLEVDRVESARTRVRVLEAQVRDERFAGRARHAGVLDALQRDLAGEPADVAHLVANRTVRH